MSLLTPPAFAETEVDESPVPTQEVEPTESPELPGEEPSEEELNDSEETVDENPPQTSGDIAESLQPTEPAESPTDHIQDLEGVEPLVGIGALLAATNPASGFNAGNIISDANFYNGAAMTATQVQTFLNQQVPKPTSKSLRNYKQTTTTQSKTKYCNAYAGKSGETAAQIIAKVGKACGISPKVILVMLQKEQSLVTTVSPAQIAYDRAMGYACPDTGPGNSANCDKAYYGFFNQVWNGTKRLKHYRLDGGYNYAPFRNNTILYNPDRACGSSSVYIQNWATASLYIYTPYQPNKAAINAGRGEGDKCSTYGNRNFYVLYKLWFGSPTTFFADVPANHQYFTAIEWMGSTGLAKGSVPAGGGAAQFKPKLSMTRGQMAVFLYRLNGRPKVNLPIASPFADVKSTHSYYPAIIWMEQQGITKGQQTPGKRKYGINDRLTRGQMAVFMYRMDRSKYRGPAVSPFSDINKGHPYYNAIAWMYHEGLAKGSQQPTGKPRYGVNGTMSREWMAVFLYRHER